MNKKTKNKIETTNKATKGFRAYCAVVITIALITVLSAAAVAADDPIAVVNNLSDFIFGLIRGGADYSGLGRCAGRHVLPES